MHTKQKRKGDSFFDALPGWAQFLVVAGSGFIAGLALTAESLDLWVAIQRRRSTVIGLTLCLILLFAFLRGRFPGFANFVLWTASLCLGAIFL